MVMAEHLYVKRLQLAELDELNRRSFRTA
jgi:hypothetical protein